MLNVDNFIHHLWHHLVFRALSEMQDTESIEELKRLVYSKMLKEIKTTVVFKDTKRAKKQLVYSKIFMNQRTTNNCCNTGHFWIKGLPKLRVFQDIESKGYKQLVYSRILTNQRATKNFRIWEYWILNSKGSNFISYICIDFKNVVD